MLATASFALSSTSALAASQQCKVINWKPNLVLNVNSALYMGTRIQLPEGLNMVTKEPVTSSNLWDASGAANQVLVRPLNGESGGEHAMVTVFLNNGQTLDIRTTRVAQSKNDSCVIINPSKILSGDDRKAIGGYQRSMQQTSMFAQQRVADLQQEIGKLKSNQNDETKQAVMKALKTYRYHIYTRYNWTQGEHSFEGKNLISDVYDDGRFTYIRLSNPSRGLLAVNAYVGGKKAIVRTDYDDATGMYSLTGIYPKFDLTLDGNKVTIERADNKTNGES